MSELTDRLTRMLSQAQGFANDAPLEALSRAQLALRTADAALQSLTGPEHDDVSAMRAIATARIERYSAVLETWSHGVRDRAALFLSNERKRLEQPIPPKV